MNVSKMEIFENSLFFSIFICLAKITISIPIFVLDSHSEEMSACFYCSMEQHRFSIYFITSIYQLYLKQRRHRGFDRKFSFTIGEMKSVVG